MNKLLKLLVILAASSALAACSKCGCLAPDEEQAQMTRTELILCDME